MASLPEYLEKTLLIGLFLICMVSFGTVIGSNYGKTQTDIVSDQITTSGIESSINDTNELAIQWKLAFQSSNPLWTVGVVAVESLFTIGKVMANTLFSIIGLYFSIISNVLGIPPIVTAVLSTIITVWLIVAVYQFFKGGN